MSQQKKLRLVVELVGEPESGKTHFAFQFPEPFLINTSPVDEGIPIAMKVLGEKWSDRFWSARSLKEVRKGIESATEGVMSSSVRTIIVDTSSDLQKLAANEYLEEKNAQNKKREKVLPIEYGYVRDKVDDIIYSILKGGKNLVVTSLFKDEYQDVKSSTGDGTSIKSYKTGTRIRDGYARLPQLEDMRLYLSLIPEKVKVSQIVNGQKVEVDTTALRRNCQVIKNRFKNKTGTDWITSLPESEMNWNGILKLTGVKEELIA